jgi:transposase
MEACGSSHYWARELSALGHTVRLVPPQYVKPYVKRGKNDRNDTAAICQAAGRPGMHFVPAKTLEQQAAGMVLKARDTLVGHRSALINTVRGHAAEFGVVATKGAAKVDVLFSAIEQQHDIPPVAKEMFILLRQQINDINARIAELDARLNASHKANPVSQRLATIPGVGPITAPRQQAAASPNIHAGRCPPVPSGCRITKISRFRQYKRPTILTLSPHRG